MEKFLVRMEKFPVKMEKNKCVRLAELELLPRNSTSWPFVRTQEMCITLLVSLRNVISENNLD
jgi:hypothetical protein